MTYTRLFYNVKTEWRGDTLVKGFNGVIREVKGNIDSALVQVGSDMINNLQKHIQKDFYDKYEPISYPRRKDHKEFGIPLDDKRNIDTAVKNNVLTFIYEPSGTHTGKIKDTLNFKKNKTSALEAERPIKPDPLHGDELIYRLESGKGYDWQPYRFKPRPFWSNFIEDENNGKMVSSFNTYMRTVKLKENDYKYTNASKKDLSFSNIDFMDDTFSEVKDFDELPF